MCIYIYIDIHTHYPHIIPGTSPPFHRKTTGLPHRLEPRLILPSNALLSDGPGGLRSRGRRYVGPMVKPWGYQ